MQEEKPMNHEEARQVQLKVDAELRKRNLEPLGAKLMGSDKVINSLSNNRGVVTAISGVVGAIWFFQAEMAEFKSELNNIKNNGSPALFRHIEEERKLRSSDHDLLIELKTTTDSTRMMVAEIKAELRDRRK